MSSMPSSVKLSFEVLVEERGDYHVAQCLQTGTIAVAKDEFAAMAKMCKMLERMVVFALNNKRSIQDIFHPAPQDIRDRFHATNECVFHTAQTRVRDNVNAFTMPGLVIEQTYASVC